MRAHNRGSSSQPTATPAARSARTTTTSAPIRAPMRQLGGSLSPWERARVRAVGEADAGAGQSEGSQRGVVRAADSHTGRMLPTHHDRQRTHPSTGREPGGFSRSTGFSLAAIAPIRAPGASLVVRPVGRMLPTHNNRQRTPPSTGREPGGFSRSPGFALAAIVPLWLRAFVPIRIPTGCFPVPSPHKTLSYSSESVFPARPQPQPRLPPEPTTSHRGKKETIPCQ